MLIATIISEGKNHGGFQKCENHYIQPSQIIFHQKGIFINFDSLLLRTPSLHHDENGLFINNFIEEPDYWICPGCKRLYSINELCSTPGCRYRGK